MLGKGKGWMNVSEKSNSFIPLFSPTLANSALCCLWKFKHKANFYALDGKKKKNQLIPKGFSFFPSSWYVYIVGMKGLTSVFTFLCYRVPPNPQLGLIYIQAPLPQNYNSKVFQLLPNKGLWSPSAEGSLMSCDWKRRAGKVSYVDSFLFSSNPNCTGTWPRPLSTDASYYRFHWVIRIKLK